MKVLIYTIRGVRGKNPRNELISLGRRGRQDWARLLPSSIAPERQRSARTRRSLRFLFRRALQRIEPPLLETMGNCVSDGEEQGGR